MSSHARAIQRTRGKKAFKEFKKANPQYKAMRFADFYELYKTGFMGKVNKEDPDVKSRDIGEEEQQELDSLFIDDDIVEEEDANVTNSE